MAFSTQKEFFHVPFMNENVEYECQQACVKLKSYDSSIDYRSWSSDKTKQSKFLSDLVTCQFPIGGSGQGDESRRREDIAAVLSTPSRSGVANPLQSGAAKKEHSGATVDPSRSVVVDKTQSAFVGSTHSDTRSAIMSKVGSAIVSGNTLQNQVHGLSVGDSLLECANTHLADYQKLMNIKDNLEKQLEVSNERLKNTSEENRKIKQILNSKLDSNTNKDFYNKIQKLIAAGKLTKNEENEMLQIYQKIDKMSQAYEILQGENMYLKRLIEKLSSRNAAMETIKTENETSTDVGYLQKEVNFLRKECVMLRANETVDYQKAKNETKNSGITDQDAENIKAIIKERDSLREKCKSLKTVEKNMVKLQHKNKEIDSTNGALHKTLSEQSNYIKDMECEMEKMQKFYEQKLQQACFREQSLKQQLADLKDDLVKCKCQAQNVEMLQMELGCMRNQISKRDMAIRDYDCQYKQLMDVVNELQAVKLQCLQDNHTQTCKNLTDDLAFFTCATLDEIIKELKKKGCITKEEHGDSEYYAYGLTPGHRDEDVYHLQKELETMKKERDNMCNESLNRLKELEAENANLLSENCHIRELVKDGEEKMVNMLKKIEHLDGEFNQNAEELRRSANELADTKKLVEDISNIQLQNQKLVNAVGAINSRDDEKIIDDLRRQLDEEMGKLKKCELENMGLLKQAEERENELKMFKEDLKKLENENSKLNHKNHQGDGGEEGAGKCNKGAAAGFEKESRKIMDEFKQECGFCCSRLVNPKSKLYAICHKLLMNGLHALSFRELDYVHKKIYAAAEQLIPRRLLYMILRDHMDEVKEMLNVITMPMVPGYMGNNEAVQKCCSCKRELCCNKSEEMLKEKVTKLEKDIETAREYLDTLKILPSRKQSQDDFIEMSDNNDATYRAASHVQKISSKHIKKLKSRLLRNP